VATAFNFLNIGRAPSLLTALERALCLLATVRDVEYPCFLSVPLRNGPIRTLDLDLDCFRDLLLLDLRLDCFFGDLDRLGRRTYVPLTLTPSDLVYPLR